MNADDDLRDLGGLWQALDAGGTSDRPVADCAKHQRAQRWYLWIEMAIASAGLVAGILLLGSGAFGVGVAAIVFSVFGGIVGWITRSANIGVLERSVSEHLEASTAIMKSRRNHNAAGVLMFLAAVAFYLFLRLGGDGGLALLDLVLIAFLIGLAVFYLRRTLRAQRDVETQIARVRAFRE